MACSGSGNRRLRYRIRGGVGPYTTSTTSPTEEAGPVVAVNAEDNSIIVEAPDGSVVAGTAWKGISHNVGSSPNCTIQDTFHNNVGCDDVFIDADLFSSQCNTSQCSTCGPRLCGADAGCQVPACPRNAAGIQFHCDVRTQSMIDAGCLPCGVSMEGATISVTDAMGVTITRVISTTSA